MGKLLPNNQILRFLVVTVKLVDWAWPLDCHRGGLCGDLRKLRVLQRDIACPLIAPDVLILNSPLELRGYRKQRNVIGLAVSLSIAGKDIVEVGHEGGLTV